MISPSPIAGSEYRRTSGSFTVRVMLTPTSTGSPRRSASTSMPGFSGEPWKFRRPRVISSFWPKPS